MENALKAPYPPENFQHFKVLNREQTEALSENLEVTFQEKVGNGEKTQFAGFPEMAVLSPTCLLEADKNFG